MENQRKITTTIDKKDWNYCHEHNLKFAHLIRMGIRDHRVSIGHKDAEPTLREMREKVEKLSILYHRAFKLLDENGLAEKLFKHNKV